MTTVKYAVAGGFAFVFFGAGLFFYLNFGSSGAAEAGNKKQKQLETDAVSPTAMLVNLSHLSADEMFLLTNRNFEHDTLRIAYTTVNWKQSNSSNLITLEVNNRKQTFSLELFDKDGNRVIFYENLNTEKVFINKSDLIAEQEYAYLVRNAAGELHAGNLFVH